MRIVSKVVYIAMILCVLLLGSVGMVACTKDQPGLYVPGTYTGKSRGMGPIVVELTVDKDQITGVSIDGPGETQGVGGKEAIEDGTFSSRILDAQSAEIDVISGATLTSNGVIEAAEEALAQAYAK